MVARTSDLVELVFEVIQQHDCTRCSEEIQEV